MNDKKFYLPIGFKHNGVDIVELPIAETNSAAEKIYTKKPSQANLHTWFGQVIASSVESIGGEPISSEFLKAEHDKKVVPASVLSIPLIDCGSLLIQIQRECWESSIKDQKFKCTQCGGNLTAEIDINLIPVPKSETGKAIESYSIELDKEYVIESELEQMKDYVGYKFTHLEFRVATLRDAIKYQEVSKDEVLFWRKIAYETLVSIYYIGEEGESVNVPDGYLSRRGQLFFDKDLSSKTLKAIRSGMQKTLPSAKFFYEEDCPLCFEKTPFFASVGTFFMA